MNIYQKVWIFSSFLRSVTLTVIPSFLEIKTFETALMYLCTQDFVLPLELRIYSIQNALWFLARVETQLRNHSSCDSILSLADEATPCSGANQV